MFVVCCVLIYDVRLLCCLSCVVRCSLLVVCCLIGACWSLCVVNCPLFAVCDLLFGSLL